MALIRDMGVIANGIYQPKLKHKYIIEFIGIGTDAEGFKVQSVNFERPKLTYDEVKLDRYNSVSYVAGKHTFETATFVFEDDVGGVLTTALQFQNEKQQKITGVGPAPLLPSSAAGELYKFVIRADMMDGNQEVFESWSYEGCWFQRLEFDSMDYSVSEAVKITCTVRYDHARQLITGTKYNSAPDAGAF